MAVQAEMHIHVRLDAAGLSGVPSLLRFDPMCSDILELEIDNCLLRDMRRVAAATALSSLTANLYFAPPWQM